MKIKIHEGYRIVFDQEGNYEYKYKVLSTMLDLANIGIFNLFIVAELTESIVTLADKTATFRFVRI
jgi:hypothetical protein